MSPPESAANQIHRYVGRLRRILEPELTPREWGTVLLPSVNGYRVDVEAADIDLEDFYDDVSQAQRLRADGKTDPAIECLRRAVAVGLDIPFQNVSDHEPQRPEFARVADDHLAAAVTLADISLQTGQTVGVAEVLSKLTPTHPLSETLYSRLILVLVADNRISEALREFENVRQSLADALGIDPGPDLRGALLAALTADEVSYRKGIREQGSLSFLADARRSKSDRRGPRDLDGPESPSVRGADMLELPRPPHEPDPSGVTVTIEWTTVQRGQPRHMQVSVGLSEDGPVESAIHRRAFEVVREALEIARLGSPSLVAH